jgi:hypothetical protein
MRKKLIFFTFLFISIFASAQGDQVSSGLMRSYLKIYVVVAVLIIIFFGIIIFLFSLEKRLKKLEAESKKSV